MIEKKIKKIKSEQSKNFEVKSSLFGNLEQRKKKSKNF